MIVCGAFITYVTLLVGFTPSSIMGILLPLLGILMLLRPIVLVHADRIEQANLLGKVMRTHPYTTHPASVRGNTLYAGGIKIAPQWMINTKLARVQEYLAALKP